MKQLILILFIFTLLSCDLNLKTDQELSRYKYDTEEARQELDRQIEKVAELELFMKATMLRDSLSMVRYKDSIQFMKLTKHMCYQSGPHRHSCQQYN